MLIKVSDELLRKLEEVIESEDVGVLTEVIHQAIRDYIENVSND
jgi:metal-responsive CopG/Arc/MetJ family transcriptional regulator